MIYKAATGGARGDAAKYATMTARSACNATLETKGRANAESDNTTDTQKGVCRKWQNSHS